MKRLRLWLLCLLLGFSAIATASAVSVPAGMGHGDAAPMAMDAASADCCDGAAHAVDGAGCATGSCVGHCIGWALGAAQVSLPAVGGQVFVARPAPPPPAAPVFRQERPPRTTV